MDSVTNAVRLQDILTPFLQILRYTTPLPEFTKLQAWRIDCRSSNGVNLKSTNGEPDTIILGLRFYHLRSSAGSDHVQSRKIGIATLNTKGVECTTLGNGALNWMQEIKCSYVSAADGEMELKAILKQARERGRRVVVVGHGITKHLLDIHVFCNVAVASSPNVSDVIDISNLYAVGSEDTRSTLDNAMPGEKPRFPKTPQRVDYNGLFALKMLVKIALEFFERSVRGPGSATQQDHHMIMAAQVHPRGALAVSVPSAPVTFASTRGSSMLPLRTVIGLVSPPAGASQEQEPKSGLTKLLLTPFPPKSKSPAAMMPDRGETVTTLAKAIDEPSYMNRSQLDTPRYIDEMRKNNTRMTAKHAKWLVIEASRYEDVHDMYEDRGSYVHLNSARTFVHLAQIIHRKGAGRTDLRHFILELKQNVDNRRIVNAFYSQFKCKPGYALEDENKTHEHFIGILQEVLQVLE